MPQQTDRVQRLVDRQRRLGEPDDLLRIADHHVVDVGLVVDHLDRLGRLALGALDLFVTAVTDQQDVVVLGGEPPGLLVHLGDQRAGGVDHLQLAGRGLLVHGRRHTVRGEHHQRTLGDLVGLLDEDRAASLQPGDHVLVVHDLLADVDRCAVLLERLLDRHHRTVDPGAVAARAGQQHAAGGRGGSSGVVGVMPPW